MCADGGARRPCRADTKANGLKPDGDVGFHRWRRVACIAMMALPLLVRGALVWETEAIEVGAKSNEREVSASYRFKNTGSKAVTILEVLPSCDCTRVETEKRTYAPGEGGVLQVHVSIDARSTTQEETIEVVTDDAPQQPVVLRFQANVEPLIGLSPRVLAWRVGEEPVEKAAVAATTGPLRIASVAVQQVSPAEGAFVRVEMANEGSEYRIHVRPRSTERTLNFTVSCKVTFVDGTTQDIVVLGMARR